MNGTATTAAPPLRSGSVGSWPSRLPWFVPGVYSSDTMVFFHMVAASALVTAASGENAPVVVPVMIPKALKQVMFGSDQCPVASSNGLMAAEHEADHRGLDTAW